MQSMNYIITPPCRIWKKKVMQDIMNYSVILQNMVVEYERPLKEINTEGIYVAKISVGEDAKG